MMKTSLLDLNFQPLTIDNQKAISSFLERYPQKLASYTFASLVSWSLVYFYEWILLSPETLLISAYIDEEQQRHLMQPIGEFSRDCQQLLLNKIEQHPSPLKISGVTDGFIESYPEFCSHFEDRNDCPRANYIYRAADLANLAGRHYEKKRNLISQAEELYRWNVIPLTKECHPRCLKILLDIGPKTSHEIPQELHRELIALEFVLANFEQLNQKGLVICVEGHPVAFSIYEELNPQTAVIHYEKADRQYKGMYQLINRETAKAILDAGYELINREEDLGLKGLRQAKQSYFPVSFETSHVLTFKRLKAH